MPTHPDPLASVLPNLGEKVSDLKWMIHHNSILTNTERQKYWEKEHSDNNYEKVWSMTDDKDVRLKIIDELGACGKVNRILIPGCGSRVNLQNDIAKQYPDSIILCTDFQGVIEVARKKRNEANIEYRAYNSSNLGFENEWDAVIIVNSVLSDSDEENRLIIKSCYNALKSGGVLLGFFPTIFAVVDISILEEDDERMTFINQKKSSFYEKNKKYGKYFIHH